MHTFCRVLSSFAVISTLCATPSVALAQAQTDPATLPARETHDKLTIAVDPYLDQARYKDRFGKKTPFDGGVVAIEVFFRNENEKPIRVGLESIRLILKPEGHDRQRLEPLAPEEVADAILGQNDPNPTVKRKPLPRGIPSSNRGKEWQQIMGALREAELSGDLVPPHGMLHGFLYFNVARHFEWLPDGDLYFPDLKLIPEQKELFYFEVSLSPARPK
jgi:hypothetical protein